MRMFDHGIARVAVQRRILWRLRIGRWKRKEKLGG